jgi:hypothetical protein
MTYPRGDDRRLDESWGWDVAVLLIFIAMVAIALWAYHGDDDERTVASAAPAHTIGQRSSPPLRTVPPPPPGTLTPLR